MSPFVALANGRDPRYPKRVLLLEEWDDSLAVVILRCLQLAGGYEVHCISGSEDTVLRRSNHCRVRYASWDTPADLVAAVAAYVVEQPIDLVIPIQESMIAMAGLVAEELEQLAPLAPLPDPVMCGRVDNKWSFHLLMSEAGVALPRCTLPGNDRVALRRELSSWGTPVMLKPSDGFGGRGIRLFEHVDELVGALDDSPPRFPDEFIIQEVIPGQDVDCSFVSYDGAIIAHTVQRSVLHQAVPFKSGLGLEFIQDDSIAAVAARFAEVSNWAGVAHLDLRVDQRTGEPKLIEVNPRYWQTLLGSLAMGTNFPDLHCRLGFGERPVGSSSGVGLWLDGHEIIGNPRNLRVLLRRAPGLLRSIDWRVMGADPHLEMALVARSLKPRIGRLIARMKRTIRRLLPTPKPE